MLEKIKAEIFNTNTTMTNLRSATVTFFSFFTDSIPAITVIRLENEKIKQK